jgi:tetratricopeptide (TPR) repeat protein
VSDLNPDDDIDTRIRDLQERIDQLRQDNHYRTASRHARELKRLAREGERVIPYLLANFYLMNDAQSLIEPDAGAEAAIETISLLESEENARRLQPDFPEREYQHTVGWMSACAYDNLAKHVAEREGQNSRGMHDCINDGINVCRRTGKLECVTCFREYASDVYRAADDIDMSLHHATHVASGRAGETDNDRRWSGQSSLTSLHLLSGNLEAARESAVLALTLAERFHNVIGARRRALALLETVLHLQGRYDDLPGLMRDAGLEEDFQRLPPAGENPSLELVFKFRDVAGACARGDYVEAIRELAYWDRWLGRQNSLDTWFEVRLRLIAAHLLAGQPERVAGLVGPLEEKARAAHDWLTLRRLKSLREGTVAPSPIAALATLSSGPFAAPAKAAGTDQETPDEPSPTEDVSATTAEATGDPVESPMTARLGSIADRLRDSGGDDALLRGLFTELSEIPDEALVEGRDAGWFIHLLHVVSRFLGEEIAAWKRAEPTGRRFPRDAVTLNVLADLGNTVRTNHPEAAAELVTFEQIDGWFRASLDLDPEHAGNHQRAGDFHLADGRTGEAERCFARAFRLDRSNGPLALRLADLYSDSDRPRDALAVLDMAIREGTSESPVFWQAGVLALSIDQYDAAISYFSRFEELQPGQAWTNYYRALAQLEAKRPGAALESVELERLRSPDHVLPLAILRAWAYAQLEDPVAVEREVEIALGQKLVDVDYLTESGLARLCNRLYHAVGLLEPASAARKKTVKVLLRTGMAPEELFQADRSAREKRTDLGYYVCVLRQPLPEDWSTNDGCLNGQQSWREYETAWGVLATDEDEAREFVTTWQKRCLAVPFEFVDVRLQGDGYEDSPGVVWQGLHQPVSADDEDEDDMDDFDDDDEDYEIGEGGDFDDDDFDDDDSDSPSGDAGSDNPDDQRPDGR